jgi:hypothetical protein
VELLSAQPRRRASSESFFGKTIFQQRCKCRWKNRTREAKIDQSIRLIMFLVDQTSGNAWKTCGE